MSFCEHCEGQRFDRARVLRALRHVQKNLARQNCRTPQGAIDLALQAVRALEIPHLDWEDEVEQVVH